MYNVIIIGAGNIGAFFDNPSSKKILTHAHAFYAHKGFQLLGFVNTSSNKAQKAAGLWGGSAFSTINEVMKNQKVDVVSVAVPDAVHYSVLKQLASFPIKLIFAEKPLTTSLKDAQEIIDLYKKNKIALTVNYTRRFVPEFRRLKEMIALKQFGEYVTGIGYYGKGLLHNGSHLIDLLRMLIGEVEILQRLGTIKDFLDHDPSVSAQLTVNKKKNFYLLAIDSRFYSLFELDIFFEKKRLRILNSGLDIELCDIQENQMFKGYKTLVKTESIQTSLYQALHFAVQNIYEHLTQNKPLLCTGLEAYKAMQVCLE